jgi:Activator of Hsp90 ATPase homolog 1-like protein
MVTVSFEERGGSTFLTIVQTDFERREDRDGIERGCPSILDALERIVVHRARRPHLMCVEFVTPDARAGARARWSRNTVPDRLRASQRNRVTIDGEEEG